MAQSLKRNTGRKAGLIVGAAVVACCVCVDGMAQDQQPTAPGRNISRATIERGVTPSANTTPANARLLIPDGTADRQSLNTGETRWLYFGAEQGKTYTIEALDPYGDKPLNGITMGVFASDGVSPPPEASVDCSQETVAPALRDAGSGTDGARCVLRTFRPTFLTTLNKRPVYISLLSFNAAPVAWIRVRESTIYGRWTTNGYDFHVELQNTTTDTINVELVFYPGTGTTPPIGNVSSQALSVPPMGAAKYVRPNGTLVAGDNKGTLRIHAGNPVNFVAGSLIANTYAYNPVTNQFIPFATVQPVNNGNASSSF